MRFDVRKLNTTEVTRQAVSSNIATVGHPVHSWALKLSFYQWISEWWNLDTMLRETGGRIFWNSGARMENGNELRNIMIFRPYSHWNGFWWFLASRDSRDMWKKILQGIYTPWSHQATPSSLGFSLVSTGETCQDLDIFGWVSFFKTQGGTSHPIFGVPSGNLT